MKDEHKTKSQLIQELVELRQKIVELQELKAQGEHASDLFQSLFHSSPIGIFIVQDGKIQLFNTRFLHSVGFSNDELLGKDSLDLVLPESRNGVRENAVRMLKGEIADPYEYKVTNKKGEILWIMETVTSIQYQGRRAALGNFMDITKLKQTEEALREKEAQYRGIFNSATDAFFIFDFNGNIVEANPEACKMHGYSHEELIGLAGKDVVHPDYYHLFEKFQWDVKTKGEFQAEAANIRKDGTPIAIEVRGAAFNYKGKKHLLAVVRDITERKRAEEKLQESEQRYRELSITDDLTRLYNSRYFYEQLQSEIKRSLRYNHPLSLLLFDIDNFKHHNDTYGHLEGDTVLARFGKVIRENMRETDSAYRYGGEEFTVILPVTPGEEGLKVAERIRERFGAETFCPRSGKTVCVTGSGGVAQYVEGESLSELITRADKSMYQAKRQGKNRIVYLVVE